jgi:ubiquitin-protein ligase
MLRWPLVLVSILLYVHFVLSNTNNNNNPINHNNQLVDKKNNNDAIVTSRIKPKRKSNKKVDSGLLLAKRRIISELKEIRKQKLELSEPFTNDMNESYIRLSPMKNNLLEWHFSFKGVENSPYADGIYHGKIILHPEYPRKAPNIIMMTPNGRWEIGKPICLSATAYHQESWNPSWNLRTLVTALRLYMLTNSNEIGAISTTKDHRKTLASISKSYYCNQCGVDHNKL